MQQYWIKTPTGLKMVTRVQANSRQNTPVPMEHSLDAVLVKGREKTPVEKYYIDMVKRKRRVTMRPKVYLAGSIRGLTYSKAANWRLDLAHEIREKITCLSPMRGKRELVGKVITKEVVKASSNPLMGYKGIVARDFSDIRRCDAVLVNLLGSTHAIGTLVEIGYAAALQKPIIVVLEEDNVHQHPFVTEPASFVVTTLDKAVHILKHLF